MEFHKIRIWLVIVIIFIISGITSYLFLGNNNKEFYEVEKTNFTLEVESTGEVISNQDIILSFEIQGRVNQIFVETGDEVKVGQVLAELSFSEIEKEILEATTNLEIEKLKLEEIQGQVDGSFSQKDFANTSLVNSIKSGFAIADNSIKNTLDIFIENADSRFPDFVTVLSDYFIKQEITQNRYQAGIALDRWKDQADQLTANNISLSDADTAISNLRDIEDLLKLVSDNSFRFEPNNDFTQAQIDGYIQNVGQARTSINSAISEIENNKDKVRDIVAETPIQNAKVENAEATISRLNIIRDKYILRAPFEGIITSDDIELGQFVNSGEMVFSMISNEPFEVEAFIPEINIASLSVGDFVEIDLDALQGQTFSAKVSHVDPKSTLKDGVTTYKILVSFEEISEEIKSGMTTNMKIIKEFVADQIVIPTYLVTEKNDQYFVTVLNSDNKLEEVKIVISQNDNKGNYLIEKGIKVGDRILIK